MFVKHVTQFLRYLQNPQTPKTIRLKNIVSELCFREMHAKLYELECDTDTNCNTKGQAQTKATWP